MRILIVITLISAARGVLLEREYEGFSVVRVVPENLSQLKFVTNWAQNLSDTQTMYSSVNFWKYPSQLESNVDVMVSPALRPQVLRLMRSKNLKPEIVIENVQNFIRKEKFYGDIWEQTSNVTDKESENWIIDDFWNPGKWPNWGHWFNTTAAQPVNTSKIGENRDLDFFKNFERIERIHSFLDQLAQKDSSYISTQSIGRSTEGRDLKIIKIGNSSQKPIVWIDGGTHAREWLGITTVLYMAYQLADGRQKCFVQNSADCPADVKELLNLYDWHILPVLNPDGYTYSRERDRMWRKTRSRRSPACIGADPNRNYDIAFGGSGTSANPCSDQFHGGTPFSEPETRAQSDYVLSQRSRIRFFLSIHTYSQLILIPWSYTAQQPPEFADLKRVADEGYRALRAKYGTQYQIGASSTFLYAAAGSASDWAFSKNIKYSYTFELRDKGSYGFIAPISAVLPTGDETFAAVKAMTKMIYRETNG